MKMKKRRARRRPPCLRARWKWESSAPSWASHSETALCLPCGVQSSTCEQGEREKERERGGRRRARCAVFENGSTKKMAPAKVAIRASEMSSYILRSSRETLEHPLCRCRIGFGHSFVSHQRFIKTWRTTTAAMRMASPRFASARASSRPRPSRCRRGRKPRRSGAQLTKSCVIVICCATRALDHAQYPCTEKPPLSFQSVLFSRSLWE